MEIPTWFLSIAAGFFTVIIGGGGLFMTAVIAIVNQDRRITKLESSATSKTQLHTDVELLNDRLKATQIAVERLESKFDALFQPRIPTNG